MFKVVILILLAAVKSHAFIELFEKGISTAENAGIYTDAALDVLDSIDDTASLNEDLKGSSKRISEIKNGLRDVDYSYQDINEIISSEGLDSEDLPAKLSSIANKIRRGKSLMKRISLLTGTKPEAITAGESIKSTAILKDIHYELALARADRQKDRQSSTLEKIKELKKVKEQRKFLISQLELTQRKSTNKKIAFNNFKFKDTITRKWN